MRGKILFGAGLAVGYLIGARAGRPAYDAVLGRLHAVADSPQVHRLQDRATEVLEDRAPKAATAIRQVTGAASGVASAVREAEPSDGTTPDADTESPGTPREGDRSSAA